MAAALVACTVLTVAIAASATPPASPARDLDTLIAEALQHHPGLDAIEHERAARQQRIPQAGVWMDPMLGLGYRNMPITAPWPGNDPMSNIEIMVSQRLPAPGVIAARQDVARASIAPVEQQQRELQVDLVRRLRTLHAQLTLSRQLRDVTRSHVAVIDRMIDAVRAKLEVGRVGQQALLRLMVRRERLDDSLADFDRRERELCAQLNSLAHLPTEDPIATPASAPPREAPALAELERQAAAGAPVLERLAAEAHSQELQARLAEAQRQPDIDLSLAYMVRLPAAGNPGMNMVSAGVALPLPWLFAASRWGALAEERRAQARATRSARDATWDRLRGELAAAAARQQRAVDKARVYRDTLVPAAQQTLDTTLTAYQVERADFAELVEAELELLDLERGLLEAHADAAVASAELDALRGQLPGAVVADKETTP